MVVIIFPIESVIYGFLGPLTIICMAACKAIVVFLPGEPIELLAGMCYGPFLGMILLYIGYTISSILIALSVKKFGINLVSDIIPEKTLNKVNDIINNNPHKVEVTLFFLYFLPAMPKDLLTYIGNLLPISISKFLLVSLFARFPALISSTIVGSRILSGDIYTIIIVYAITYLVSFAIAGIYNKFFSKTKEHTSTKNKS